MSLVLLMVMWKNIGGRVQDMERMLSIQATAKLISRCINQCKLYPTALVKKVGSLACLIGVK